MNGYAVMTKEKVIDLTSIAIAAIQEERKKRLDAAIAKRREVRKPNFFQRMGLQKYKWNPTNDEIVEEIHRHLEGFGGTWNFYFHVSHYSTELEESFRDLFKAALVADDKVLVKASLAAALYNWS